MDEVLFDFCSRSRHSARKHLKAEEIECGAWLVVRGLIIRFDIKLPASGSQRRRAGHPSLLSMGVLRKRPFLVRSLPGDAVPEGRFTTGCIAPETGIYRVVHAGHRLPHEVIILRGQVFPKCSKCSGSVLFELAHAAPDLFQSGICRIYELPELEEKESTSCA